MTTSSSISQAISDAQAQALAAHDAGTCHLSEWSCSYCEVSQVGHLGAGEITGRVLEGRVCSGVEIEVHGYLGTGPIVVHAATADAAGMLMRQALEEARAAGDAVSLNWPPRDASQ